jgi:uncharacterized protein
MANADHRPIVAANRTGRQPMEPIVPPPGPARLAPVGAAERIHALDVVRGFALIGIFLMNVEFFNRPMSSIGEGLPSTLTGADWWAGWLIYMFVQGKFWTMFSLLFGMGFAVMLTRAERAGRDFLRPYLRRIAALAVFGVVHHIFIWGGDILFSYSVGAAGLLLMLYARARWIVAATLVCVAGGFIPGFDGLFQVAFAIAFMGLGAFFLRSESVAYLRGRALPIFAAVFFCVACLVTLATLAAIFIPATRQGLLPMAIVSAILWLIGLGAARWHDPASQRMRSLGIGTYLLPFVLMTAFGAAQLLRPADADALPAAPAATQADAGRASAPDAKKAKQDADEAAEAKAERAQRLVEREEEMAAETQAMSRGTYAEAVRVRAAAFAKNAAGEAPFAVIVVGMFLLGAWFVRSGIMDDTAANLGLFRKLALFGIPIGCGLGLLGGTIATGIVPGQPAGPYQTAIGMTMLGNLPACLGYVGLLVLMLHSGGIFRHVRVLAPAGRMALTNYLTQSVLGTLFFYGYGLGHWGLGRAWQVLFVFTVFTLQVVFSHWWLARFQFGPMEWLWRAITYWQRPPMRRLA